MGEFLYQEVSKSAVGLPPGTTVTYGSSRPTRCTRIILRNFKPLFPPGLPMPMHMSKAQDSFKVDYDLRILKFNRFRVDFESRCFRKSRYYSA